MDMRSYLGNWIRRKLDLGVIRHTASSQKILNNCGVSEVELRKQWKLQVDAQISVRARQFSYIVNSKLRFTYSIF